MGSYKAAWLIPINSKKVLTNNGWIFVSKKHLPPLVVAFIIDNLKLSFEETYLHIVSYSNNKFQAVVIENEKGEIEEVQIKIYGNNLDLFLSEFKKHSISEMAELFIPSEEDAYKIE